MAITTLPYINISEASYTCTNAATSNTFTFYYNFLVSANSITATSDSPWVIITSVVPQAEDLKMQGEFTVSIKENSTNAQRQAIVRITGTGADKVTTTSDYITIIQEAGTSIPSGTITSSALNNKVKELYTGRTFSLSFTTSNIQTSTINVTSDSTFLRINSFGTSSFNYTIDKNSTYGTRVAKVTISGIDTNGDVVSCVVTFEQAGLVYSGEITFDENPKLVGEGEHTENYIHCYYTYKDVASIKSVTITYDGDEEWISEGSGSRDISFSSFNFTYKANTGAKRTATVTYVGVYSKDSSLTCTGTLTITQDASTQYQPPIGNITVHNVTEDYLAVTGQTYFTVSNVVYSSVSVTQDDSSKSWATITTAQTDTGYTITYSLTDSDDDEEERVCALTIFAEGTDANTLFNTLYIWQKPCPTILEFPIFEDTYITLTGDTTYSDYTIEIGDEVIYTGRAYFKDGTSSIKLNDIMADYVIESINLNREGLQDNGGYASATFTVDGTVQYFIKCYNNWDYNSEKPSILSQPIETVLDNRQLLLFTGMDYSKNGATLVTESQLTNESTRRTVYNLNTQIGTLVRTLSSIKSVTCTAGDESLTYSTEYGCYPYVLYYRNGKGGYDSLRFKGKILPKDSITLKTYKRNINNTTLNRATTQYRKDIKKQWQLTTNYLTDKQSKLMYNLIESPEVYIHLLDEDKIYPVNITDTSMDYKLWRNQSKKPYTYTVNVEIAQDRFRR